MKPFRVLSPLHKASRQVQIYMTARCRPLGVSTVEAHVLGYCAGRGTCPIGELQRVLGHNKSTLTAMLDRLEQRTLVTRRSNPSDRRSWIIELTGEGKALAGRLRTEYEAFESTLVKQIKARDLEGFEAVMAAIAGVTKVDFDGGVVRPGRKR